MTDKNIRNKIIAACDLKPSDIILEIGAGRGELTELIAKEVNKIYALEIDPYLCEILREDLKERLNAKIINQDILKFDLKKYLLKPGYKIKAIGNIPYYISSPVIEYLFKFRQVIDTVFITVQKEFARRMVAAPGSKEYGSFSCFVQYYAEPKILFYIKNTCFFPSPKVDSCFLRMAIRDNLGLCAKKEGLLFKVIRAAFNKRRKTLRNSLDGVIPQGKLEAFFHKYRILNNIRPEDLRLQDFVNLINL